MVKQQPAFSLQTRQKVTRVWFDDRLTAEEMRKLKRSLAGLGASDVQFQLRSVTFTASTHMASKVRLFSARRTTGLAANSKCTDHALLHTLRCSTTLCHIVDARMCTYQEHAARQANHTSLTIKDFAHRLSRNAKQWCKMLVESAGQHIGLDPNSNRKPMCMRPSHCSALKLSTCWRGCVAVAL